MQDSNLVNSDVFDYENEEQASGQRKKRASTLDQQDETNQDMFASKKTEDYPLPENVNKEQLIKQLDVLKKDFKLKQSKMKEMREATNQQRTKLKEYSEQIEKLVQYSISQNNKKELKLAHTSYLDEIILIKEQGPMDERLVAMHNKIKESESIYKDLKQQVDGYRLQANNQGFALNITDLSNKLSLRTREIEQVEKQKQLIEKQKVQNTTLLEQYMKDNNNLEQINNLKEELTRVKEKTRKLAQEDIVYQKKFMQQQKELMELEKRYRETCQQMGTFGNPMSLLNDDIGQKKRYVEDRRLEQKISVSKTMEEKFDEHSFEATMLEYKQLTSEHESNERVYKKKISKLLNAITLAKNELADAKKQLREKEYEIKIAQSKCNEVIRVKVPSQNVLQQSSLQMNDKRDFDMKKKVYSKLSAGVMSNSLSEMAFNDIAFMESMPAVDILLKSITVFHKQHKIYGFQVSYWMNDTDEMEGPMNCLIMNVFRPDIQSTTLEIKKDDKLKFISGYFTTRIHFLRLITECGDGVAVGQLLGDKQDASKEFRIEVPKDFMINSFFGVLDYNEESTNPMEMHLVAIGLQGCTKLKYKHQHDQEIEEVLSQVDQDDLKNNLPDLKKIRYKLKKIPHNLVLKKEIQFSEKELLIQQQQQNRRQISLSPSKKLYNPSTYKAEEYKQEENHRIIKQQQRQQKRSDFVRQFRMLGHHQKKLVNNTFSEQTQTKD